MQFVRSETTLAGSDETVVAEGNRRFPRPSIRRESFQARPTRTVCPWRGDHLAFGCGVRVVP